MSWKRFFLLLAISALALLVHGYHYGIEDEAIYLPAVKQHLNPVLYPFDSAFFQSQTNLTLFPYFMALLCGVTHLPLDWVFFGVYCISTFLLVLALRQLAERFFQQERARWAAVLLPSALLTLPVAGTALFIMDQHMHPRNLATIALLFAIAAALDKRRAAAFGWVALAALFHPLMTLYGASLVVMLAWRSFRLHLVGFALFLPLAWFFLPRGSVAWEQVVQPYNFLWSWAWYEWLGIFGPLAGLMGCAWWAKTRGLPSMSESARKLALFGSFYFLVAVTFTYLERFKPLAPLQPMRSLQLIYLLLFLFVGGMVGQAGKRFWAPASALFLVLCGGMCYAQRQEFPASPHIEWPGAVPANAWLQAFDWIRRNTPTRAYFVADPYYLERPGEDFHGFRGLAERSVLADRIKDRSVATVSPGMAEEWLKQSEAQRNWKNFNRADLLRLKQRFGVDWVLFERGAPPLSDGLTCPYRNEQVQVCRID